ncbi:alpha/beta fold hydrolase [Agrobacterium tumefaciens]|uniref:alpha/beta hydrolase n=1 Tax=Agrobacterium fabrum TaxID=1176649 RepID=UPI00157328E0|nr:alpha/beta fold hydrolase [Agrobacterium fabrum]NTE84569.1 alpha/beta fold hydrolase [Agrobacterium tumefaciens]
MTQQSYARRSVTITTDDGIQLSGYFYVPSGGTSRLPAVMLSHGFGATVGHYIDRFAEVFASAGIAVVLYDHRNFGGSGGERRGEADPWQQIRDSRDVLTWLQHQDEVDPERIGVWGTSYSGGHALVLGAIDRRLRCIVAQVPTISGYQQSLRRIRPDAVSAMRRVYDADRAGRYRGDPPARRQIVAVEKDDPAIYHGEDARHFYLSAAVAFPEGYWDNHVTLRSTEMSSEYEPGVYVHRITPAPLLMIVAENDEVTPSDLALDAYRQALEPKDLVLIKGGHFSPYDEQFEIASEAALRWLRKHLGVGSAPAPTAASV